MILSPVIHPKKAKNKKNDCFFEEKLQKLLQVSKIVVLLQPQSREIATK